MPRGNDREDMKFSEDKERILKCINKRKNFVQLAHTLEINSSTTYNIVRANKFFFFWFV